MKIVIPGGTGQVGTLLARAFHHDGHEVIVLSRTPYAAPWRMVAWNPQIITNAWVQVFDRADVIINLAGQSVNCRYTPANRAHILESRLLATRAIGTALTHMRHPPALWLQASTATIYAHRYDAPNDDLTGMIGGTEAHAPDTWRFSIEVATAWEHAIDAFRIPAMRVVKMRSAMVMSPDRGGVFDVLLGLVRHGLGGTQGDGQQYISWIHDQDFIRAISWLMTHAELTDAINLSAPHPLPNAVFMRILRKAWGMPVGLPSTTWMLEIGAYVLRTETELILKSRRVIPTRLMASGFQFRFPTWPTAANDLCQRWRTAQHDTRT